MKRHALVAVATTALGLLVSAQAPAQDSNPAVIFQWNQLAQDTIPSTTGPLALRQYTILHVAMFDAANSIARRYTPFHASVAASSGASMEAAAAQAGHDVLTALVGPSAAYDTALNAKLATLPPGLAAQGVEVGKAAAAQTLAWRANDGIFGPPVPYSLPEIAGLWQPAAPGVPPGLTQVPGATPFTMETITQFLVPRFPELTSARYTADFDEVRLAGDVNSATRTATQTQTAQLFAGVITSTNIFMMWNNVAREVSVSQHLTLLDSARLFAFMNASATDSLLSTVTGKFIYGLWRPITAIRNADDDLNPGTVEVPGWTPLITTPPYPSYPGNMAGVGACASRALEYVLGTDAVGFSVTWIGSGGNANVTRSYSSFSELAQQQADSRIYAGIHYRFDNEVSQASCVKIVAHAAAHVMNPL
jgi:hypothetical protein